MVLACGVATTACSRRSRTPGDTAVLVIEGTIHAVDPRFAFTNHDQKVSQLVVPGLTSVDQPSLEPRLDLAAEVTRIDSLTWDVVLREDARFSDGTFVRAADVAYTYHSTMDKGSTSVHQGPLVERFRRVEVLSERSVRFHLVSPLGTFMSDISFGIISEKATRAAGGTYRDGRVIGAGPYRVVSYHPERVRLVRNEYWHGGEVKIPRIDVRTVRDDNARALMLVGGSADLTQNSIRPDLVGSIASRKRVHVTSGPSAILSYLMMQNDDPVLRDLRVRRAIAYAVDRRRIVSAKFHNRAVLATGLVAPSHWAYFGDVRRYEHDLDKARALLDEAGYPDPDGPGGRPRMKLTYKTSANSFRVAIAKIIAAQLGDVGIEVEVRAFEFGTFFTDVKKGNYQLASMQTASITEPDYYYAYFHTSRIPKGKKLDGGNRWRYRNPKLDALMEAGRRESDRDRRYAIYREVQQILARDVPIIPLWHEDNVAVMNVDFVGYELLPNARYANIVRAAKRR